MDYSKRLAIRLLYCVALFFLSSAIQSQGYFGTSLRTINDAYQARGLAGYDPTGLSNSELDRYTTYGATTIHIIFKWNAIQTGPNTYNWSYFFSEIKKVTDKGFWVTFQINTGTDAPITGTNNWLTSYVSTFTTIGGNENGPYPDYYDADYIGFLNQFYDSAARYIAYNFTASMKKKLLAQYAVFSSTGDSGPFKGNSCTPSNCLGYSDNTTWKDWSMARVADCQRYIFKWSLTYSIAYNTGNNHENLDRYAAIYPFGFGKNGEISHAINFFAEGVTLTSNVPNLFIRGEAQDDILTTTHAHRDGFQMMISALALRMDFINITGGWFNNVREAGESTADPRMTNYFVKYVRHNDVSTATAGFIQLAQKISFDDVVNFPTGVYGVLIDPTKTTQYNNRVNSVNSSTNGATAKKWLLIDANRDFINPARITAITNYGAPLGANYNPNANDLNYDNDYGYSLLTNYEFNCKQNNAFGTSLGTWRTGSDTSMMGRFGRKFKTTSGGETMSFDIDNRWCFGITTCNIRYKITYYDNGTGSFTFYANKSGGMTSIGTVSKTNTGQRKEYIVTVSNSILGTADDFQLRYVSGSNTEFNMIEFEKVLPD